MTNGSKIIIINRQSEFIVFEDDNQQINVEVDKVDIHSKIKKRGSKVTNVALGAVTIPIYIVLFVYGSFNVLIVWLFSLVF